MSRLFVSVPTKLLLLVVSALLLLSAGISVMSIDRLNKEFKRFQVEKIQQGQDQLRLHSDVAKEQLGLWIESFTDVIQLDNDGDMQALVSALSRQFDALQINHNVENVWLMDGHGQLLYQSIALNQDVKIAAESALTTQQPWYQLTCAQQCLQLMAVPLLTNNGESVVLVMTISLVDIIYSINQALNSEIAIVSFDNDSAALMSNAQFLSTSNSSMIAQIFR